MAIEPQSGTRGQWHGTHGRHYFTPGNLQLRAMAYWNRWSEDWSGFDYIQYCGGCVYIPQTANVTWMINFQEYLQVPIKGYNPKVNEDLWNHPGIFLNDPNTHIIFPPAVYKKNRMYRVRLRPPPGWKGLERMPEAEGYICCHWAWTWCDLTQAFMNAPGSDEQHQSFCEQEPWWSKNNMLDKWVNRKTYAQCSSSQSKESSWGPFLPCKFDGFTDVSLWFRYRLKFKVIGNSIWPTLPRNNVSDGLVPQPPNAPGERFPHTKAAGKKRSRPQDESDIWPGDLDSTGILKERALKRIIGDNKRDERRKMENKRRLELIAEKLERILQQRNLLKRRRMGDTTLPPNPPPRGGGL